MECPVLITLGIRSEVEKGILGTNVALGEAEVH